MCEREERKSFFLTHNRTRTSHETKTRLQTRKHTTEGKFFPPQNTINIPDPETRLDPSSESRVATADSAGKNVTQCRRSHPAQLRKDCSQLRTTKLSQLSRELGKMTMLASSAASRSTHSCLVNARVDCALCMILSVTRLYTHALLLLPLSSVYPSLAGFVHHIAFTSRLKPLPHRHTPQGVSRQGRSRLP